jgi:hypothetical protein
MPAYGDMDKEVPNSKIKITGHPGWEFEKVEPENVLGDFNVVFYKEGEKKYWASNNLIDIICKNFGSKSPKTLNDKVEEFIEVVENG